MASTHYMDLLMQNSPWNLILFMAIPVVLAESIAISELYLLWSNRSHPHLEKFKKICGILGGLAFLLIIIYFIPAIVVPLTKTDSWRTWIDVAAISAYLLSGIPMILIALLNMGLICGKEDRRQKQLAHIIFLACFLVLSHIAMIFGMVDPSIAGWDQDTGHMHSHADMEHPTGHQTGHQTDYQMRHEMGHQMSDDGRIMPSGADMPESSPDGPAMNMSGQHEHGQHDQGQQEHYQQENGQHELGHPAR